jgi:beta-phosphoglucomutase
VFDFNGTLSHDEPLLCAIYQELFAEHGRPLSEAEYYDELAGRSEEAIIGGWLGVEGDELRALVDERVERYRLRADGSTVPGPVREAVREAARHVPVAVVSGAYRREIEPVLRGAELAEAIAVVVAADDVTHGKPHPEGYLSVLARLGHTLEPGEVVAFEDTEAGVASATEAGLHCVGVLGTMGADRLARAHELVERIDVALLERLIGPSDP